MKCRIIALFLALILVTVPLFTGCKTEQPEAISSYAPEETELPVSTEPNADDILDQWKRSTIPDEQNVYEKATGEITVAVEGMSMTFKIVSHIRRTGTAADHPGYSVKQKIYIGGKKIEASIYYSDGVFYRDDGDQAVCGALSYAEFQDYLSVQGPHTVTLSPYHCDDLSWETQEDGSLELQYGRPYPEEEKRLSAALLSLGTSFVAPGMDITKWLEMTEAQATYRIGQDGRFCQNHLGVVYRVLPGSEGFGDAPLPLAFPLSADGEESGDATPTELRISLLREIIDCGPEVQPSRPSHPERFASSEDLAARLRLETIMLNLSVPTAFQLTLGRTVTFGETEADDFYQYHHDLSAEYDASGEDVRLRMSGKERVCSGSEPDQSISYDYIFDGTHWRGTFDGESVTEKVEPAQVRMLALQSLLCGHLRIFSLEDVRREGQSYLLTPTSEWIHEHAEVMLDEFSMLNEYEVYEMDGEVDWGILEYTFRIDDSQDQLVFFYQIEGGIIYEDHQPIPFRETISARLSHVKLPETAENDPSNHL